MLIHTITFICFMMVFVFRLMQKMYELKDQPLFKALMVYEILSAVFAMITFGLLLFKILT